ncbi:MAG: glycine cleavage system aminomethyltransferase GcvT, partial [Acidobacteria bacterium]|nr:glycine cleavage system aminomethyltransferase GcvT [Acidobacteriota bacterium]
SEHMAVRTRAGVFDVSHMGEIEVAGKNAVAAVQRIACSDPAQLKVGQAQYSGLLTPQGTFLDDTIVYRMAPIHFLLVVNAGNIAKDYAWVSEQVKATGDAVAIDSSSRYALIAIQGPASREVLQPLTGVELADIAPFWFSHGEVANARATIARTGYTGEDGYEIFIPPDMADRVWQAILESGRAADIVPAGLGARDTLRLEASMRLYGNDIDESTTVLEAGLGWMIGWTNETFIGRDRLREQKDSGVSRRLVGFEMMDRGIARHGYRVMQGNKPVGVVTSGTRTPYLGKAIGMAYVVVAQSRPGTEIEIDIRGRVAKARVVPMPFYKRQK